MNIDSTYDYVIFTDGSCLSNPNGVGGFAFVKIDAKTFERVGYGGGSLSTTNNRMEMMACISALESIEEPSKIMIVTDSTYIKFAFTKEWLSYWKHNSWRTSSQKLVKNKDLWLKLDSLVSKHNVQWEWVKGHNGQPENEICDTWAQHFSALMYKYLTSKDVEMTREEIEAQRIRFM